MAKRKNYRGQRFGKLTAIAPTSELTKQGRVLWSFECDCKNKVIRNPGDQGHESACLECKGLKPGRASRNNVVSYYKYDAKRKEFEFLLSDNHLDELFASNCHYCGALPSNRSFRKNNNGEFIYPGIDRINPNLGYVPSNVVPACYSCNHAKARKSYEEFVAWGLQLGGHLGRIEKAP